MVPDAGIIALTVILSGFIAVSWRGARHAVYKLVLLLPAFILICVFYGNAIQPTLGKLQNGRLLQAGCVETVEGVASIDHPKNYKNEMLHVGSRTFTYNPYAPTNGFHDATYLGGPLHDGDHLRVRSVGNDIVRIERAD